MVQHRHQCQTRIQSLTALFGIAIDFILRQSVDGYITGIAWLNSSTLGDLDFSDDIALLSDSSANMQVNTKGLSSIRRKMWLIISSKKPQI